jgi:cobalt-zinc-cadmium efflux system membrane fusion protein
MVARRMTMKRLSVITVVLAALAASGVLGCTQNQASTNEQASAENAAFCEEHQIAEARCPFCNPELLETMGFCSGHGVPEAICYQCDPEVIPAFKASGDWCAGHDRPESQCYICNPELNPARKQEDSGDTSRFPESDGVNLGIASSPERVPRTQRPPSVHCSTEDLVVRFDTPDVAGDAGLELVEVQSRPITKTVECNAVIDFDGDRHAELATQVPGVAAAVHRDFGDRVARGAALATITAPDLGEAKASLLQADANHRLWEENHSRQISLQERGLSSQKEVLESETRLAERKIAQARAQHELLSLGLSMSEIEEVRRSGDTSPTYIVRAPFNGVVVDRNITVGEVVEPSQTLFSVADVSRMWARLDVYESDAREIRVGQPVVLRVEGLPGESYGAHITWVSSRIDPDSRTLPARAELDNPGGELRANMFARAIVSVRDQRQALVVPKAAVQWEGCCNVVFVRKSETLYEPRKVLLGTEAGTVYEVLDGVSAGEPIVTQGSFLLKTEIMKGNIGAGCCEVRVGT